MKRFMLAILAIIPFQVFGQNCFQVTDVHWECNQILINGELVLDCKAVYDIKNICIGDGDDGDNQDPPPPPDHCSNQYAQVDLVQFDMTGNVDQGPPVSFPRVGRWGNHFRIMAILNDFGTSRIEETKFIIRSPVQQTALESFTTVNNKAIFETYFRTSLAPYLSDQPVSVSAHARISCNDRQKALSSSTHSVNKMYPLATQFERKEKSSTTEPGESLVSYECSQAQREYTHEYTQVTDIDGGFSWSQLVEMGFKYQNGEKRTFKVIIPPCYTAEVMQKVTTKVWEVTSFKAHWNGSRYDIHTGSVLEVFENPDAITTDGNCYCREKN